MYTEGNGIRTIGRLLGMSHVTVIRWIRRIAKKLSPPIPSYAKHIEIDELYFYLGSKKRKRWLWLAICRDTKRILGFCIGGRGHKTIEKLYYRISHIQCERYYTDQHGPFTKVLPKEKHRSYPNQTNTIEGINSAIRHLSGKVQKKEQMLQQINFDGGGKYYIVDASLEQQTYIPSVLKDKNGTFFWKLFFENFVAIPCKTYICVQ